ncbi:unnamed protein product [Adineta steineri]|uniref:Uncharacterized protein n=1 Tax=Adineta steineri TaxID=433720 RepID=A0A815DCI5_9BILA|nr:unnamed protein product [Adineta steineri]CAF1097684.1 unnamed protein product [Adineta steineri]CAF1295392.1 unnamed protein product [Adineta steineri]
MNGHQQQQPRSDRYPNLLVTVKHETNERLVTENYSNSQKRRSKKNYRPTNFHPTTIFYNSNHHYRQKQHFTRTLPSTNEYYDRLQYHNYQQPIRPLMEIKNNHTYISRDLNDDDDDDIAYLNFKPKEPTQRGQYRNRKAELDWDHAFDLDQIHLYTTQNDIDNHSLISFHSSSDNSFSSV